MHGVDAFLGLGSNLDLPLRQIASALRELEAHSVRIVRRSGSYLTEPVGGPPQPWYVNAVAAVRFSGGALDLLRLCQSVESLHGRRREAENAPRTLDLDLLSFRDLVMSTPELTLPHPRFRERRFVLVPWAEIAPELVDPVSGLTLRELLHRCPDPSAVLPVAGSVDRLESRA